MSKKNLKELLADLWEAHDRIPAVTETNGKDRESIREAIKLIDQFDTLYKERKNND